MDYIVVRRCRRGGYELLDEFGDYVGYAPTLAHARRFADDAGASLDIDLGAPEPDSSRPMASPTP